MAETVRELVTRFRANPHGPEVQDQLIALGDETVTALLAAIEETSAVDPWVREAPQLLGRIEGDTAVAALIGLLKHAEKHVVTGAAISLGHRGDVAAAEALIAVLAHPEQDVRKYAANALGRIRSTEAVEPMIALLASDHWYVKADAAEALSAIGDRRAVPALLEVLDEHSEGSEFVLGYSAEGLATFNAPEAIEPLIRLLGSESHRVVEAVQASLMVLARGRPHSLLEAAQDPRALVRARAITILGVVGDQASALVLVAAAADEDKGVRDAAQTAIKALRRGGIDVSGPSRTLRDRMVDVRRALDSYFVLPSVQGFSPYRTGASVHLFFSLSVGCGLGVLSQVWLGVAMGVLVGAVVAGVILLWGVGWMIGIASHYNPLLTLIFMVAPFVLFVVFGRGLLLSMTAAGVTHGLFALVLRRRASSTPGGGD